MSVAHLDEAGPVGGRARPVAAVVCGALALVALVATVFGVWARATILDRSATASVVHDIAEEPEVQAALAGTLADVVTDKLRLPDDVVTDLPPALDEIRPALRAAFDELVERVFRRVLEDPDVADLLAGVAAEAHDAAMELLSGDGLVDGVTVSDGEVSVNLLPLLSRGLVELDRLGVPGLADVRELPADGDPAEQITSLETATGRDLPDDFGQLVIYRTEQVDDGGGAVAAAQRLAVVARRALVLLVAATAVLLAATVVVARDRVSVVLRLAVGAGAAMVVTRAAVRAVVDEGADLAQRPAGAAVIETILTDVSPGLLRLAGVVLLAAAAVAAIAMSRRGWRHDDLVIVAAVGIGLAVVALFGLGLWTLLAGFVAGAMVIPIERRLRAR